MDVRYIEYEDGHCYVSTQDSVLWLIFVNTVMIVSVR
jgi:hypothetical protein